MKQWVAKVNTPWAKEGCLVPKIMQSLASPSSFEFEQKRVYPNEYPDLFEQLEVKTDEELLVDIMFSTWPQNEGWWGPYIRTVIEWLLSRNAINPEFLKSLRQKESK